MLTRLETHLWDQNEHHETSLRQAETVVMALRRKLREYDPSLPHECDGNRWAPIEAPYIRP